MKRNNDIIVIIIIYSYLNDVSHIIFHYSYYVSVMLGLSINADDKICTIIEFRDVVAGECRNVVATFPRDRANYKIRKLMIRHLIIPLSRLYRDYLPPE